MKKTLLLGSLCVLTGLGAIKLETDKTPAYAEIAQAEITPSSPQITLLNPGNEPKQELRLNPTAATQKTSKMTMNTEMKMLVDGQNFPQVNSPKTTINIEFEVTNIAKNGDINANFKYTNVEVVAEENTPPELLSTMETQMNQLLGLSGSFLLDNRGFTKDAKINFTENMDANNQQMLASMVNSLEQLSSPLPIEAVGKGAQWQVSLSQFTLNGIKMNQVTTYELTDIQDNIATLNVKVEQQAGEQNINAPGMPPNASMTLTSLTGVGSGKVTMDLTQIIPINATIEMKSNLKMKMIEPGSNQENILESQSLTQLELQLEHE